MGQGVVQETTESQQRAIPGRAEVFLSFCLLDPTNTLGIRRLNLEYKKKNNQHQIKNEPVGSN